MGFANSLMRLTHIRYSIVQAPMAGMSTPRRWDSLVSAQAQSNKRGR